MNGSLAGLRVVEFAGIGPGPHAAMLRLLELERLIAGQYDGTRWGELTGALASTFASRPQPHWAKLFEGSDASVAPVLTAQEAPDDPHHVARHSSVEHDGLPQAAPSPRFSRTAGGIRASGDGEAMLQVGLAHVRCLQQIDLEK